MDKPNAINTLKNTTNSTVKSSNFDAKSSNEIIASTLGVGIGFAVYSLVKKGLLEKGNS